MARMTKRESEKNKKHILRMGWVAHALQQLTPITGHMQVTGTTKIQITTTTE